MGGGRRLPAAKGGSGMWTLGAAWLLLGAACSGSAQLMFAETKSVELNVYNETIILPCIVTNLQMKNIKAMFVKWKLEKKEFFTFEGLTRTTHTHENFSTAKLVSEENLSQGDASLSILTRQAIPGNYSCEVTESNREGEIVMPLIYSPGSAQLTFAATKSAELYVCRETVTLPCIVTNLQMKNIKAMFVKWKLEKKEFFTFEGLTRTTHTNESFSTAKLASEETLSQGNASLSISIYQAIPGNYSCEVTESNREGEIVMPLIYGPEKWFTKGESSLVIVFLVLAILFYWSQLGIILLKYKITLLKKVCLISGGLIIIIFAIAGSVLLVSAVYVPKNQIGLGIIVIPAVILVPLQYFVLQTVLEEKRSLIVIGVIVLKSIGYLIAVIGFALCLGACPSKSSAIVIAGLTIMALIEAVGLIYLIFRGLTNE
uniref:Leukocyte surface antigen CD47 n=1 Tax=Pelusios castaneus TaxID=367368 RepID=A0A8C8VDW3_9SAUR